MDPFPRDYSREEKDLYEDLITPTSPLVTRVYKRRWAILFIYFMLSLSVNTTQYSFTAVGKIEKLRKKKPFFI